MTGVQTCALPILNALADTVSARTQDLDAASDRSREKLTAFGTELEAEKQRVAEIVESSGARLSALLEEVRSGLSGLHDSAEEAVGRLGEAGTAISDGQGKLKVETDKASQDMRSLSTEMSTIRDEIDRSAETLGVRLGEANSLFQQRLAALKDGSEESAVALREASDHVRSVAGTLAEETRRAMERLQEAGYELERRGSGVGLATDQAQARLQGLAQQMAAHTTTLTETVGGVTERLTALGQEFGDTVGKAGSQSEETVTKFNDAAAQARDRADALAGVARRLDDQLATTLGSLDASAERVAEQSQVLSARVGQSGEGLGETIRALESLSDAVIAAINRAGGEVRQGLRDLAGETEQTASRSLNAAKQLGDVRGRVEQTGKEVEDILAKAGDTLIGKVENLRGVAEAANQDSRVAANEFAEQAAALHRASEETAEQLERLRSQSAAERQNHFLMHSRTILETLHNMTVDITRLLEEEMPDKLWRRFEKGEISVFTRRLANLGDDLPLDRIQAKYAADGNFRNAVNGYLNEVDRLLDGTGRVEGGSVVSAALLTSDVGKLYLTLCEAVGREPKASPAFTGG